MNEINFLKSKITSALSFLYPDKKVIALYQKDSNIYNSVREYASLKNLSVDIALKELGYEYARQKNVRTIDENYILNELLKIYPSYSYPGISDIKIKDLSLWKEITKYVNPKDITFKQLLSNLGFEKSTTYDRYTLNNLLNNYQAKPVMFSNIFDVTRQAVELELNKETNRIPFWETSHLTDSETLIFEDMINHYVMNYTEQEATYRIFFNGKSDNPEFAFFVKNKNEIKCVYLPPKSLKDLLIQNNYHIYKENELMKIQELLEHLSLNGNTSRTVTEAEMKLLTYLTARKKNNPYTRDWLLKYYGFENVKVVDRRFVDDTEIKELLESYSDINLGYVKIPIDSEDYQRIVNLGRNRGMLLGEFIKSFGLSYERRPDISNKRRQKKELLQKYLVRSNEVYISSYDPLYYNLTNTSKNHNMSLDNYLMNEFGFKRIRLEELPTDYKQYNWRKYIVDFEKEEQFVIYIELNLLLEDKQVYLDSQSVFYTKLFMYAVQYDHTINSILEEWEFVRTYHRPLDFQPETENFDVELSLRKQLLDELDGIQGDLEKEEITSERRKRSKKLVQLMKLLYSDKCQLCDYSNNKFSPLIIMNSGRNYSEVHHIHRLSSEQSENDEAEIVLDSYKNVIVVCSHHHKVLHYENGGYESLLFDEKNKYLYFRNDKGAVPVVTNFHLIESIF